MKLETIYNLVYEMDKDLDFIIKDKSSNIDITYTGLGGDDAISSKTTSSSRFIFSDIKRSANA